MIPKLADISMFEDLQAHANAQMGVPQTPMTPMSVFNSGAAPLLQEYDTAKRGSALCDKYITQMQQEDELPADLLTAVVTAKEKYKTKLLETKQKIMEQSEDEPLDAFDRGVFQTLAPETQAELEGVFAADEVLQRAKQMRAETAADRPESPSPASEAMKMAEDSVDDAAMKK